MADAKKPLFLYKIQFMLTTDIEEYILDHIDPEPEHLQKLDRDTHVNVLRPRMLSGHLQGRILKMFCQMIKAQKVLEIGTFTGYSAQCLAEGLPKEGVLHTIEVNDELEEFILNHLNESPQKDKIILHIGDALKIIDQLEETFDLVFIDANKRHYIEYFEAVLPMLSDNGYIIADNTLWDGKVTEDVKSKDAQTIGILKFNDYIREREDVEKVIFPLRDGLTVIRKK